jgi:hypothetical protein
MTNETVALGDQANKYATTDVKAKKSGIGTADVRLTFPCAWHRIRIELLENPIAKTAEQASLVAAPRFGVWGRQILHACAANAARRPAVHPDYQVVRANDGPATCRGTHLAAPLSSAYHSGNTDGCLPQTASLARPPYGLGVMRFGEHYTVFVLRRVHGAIPSRAMSRPIHVKENQ